MKRNGFTLVELAIALVIIGLMIGVVLKGRAMIEQAKVNRVASDVHGLVAAVDTFQNKYGYLPGDIPSKDTIKIGGHKNCNTNSTATGQISSGQSQCAIKELIWAGLISGNANSANGPITGPLSPYGTQYTFNSGSGQSGNTVGTYITVSGIPHIVAGELDKKYDNAYQKSGDIQDTTGTSYPQNGGKKIASTTLRWWAF